jgi:hypothetical protein
MSALPPRRACAAAGGHARRRFLDHAGSLIAGS